MRRSEAATADLLGLGWAALADARWEEARDLFAQAIAADASAEAFEGASWASWWLDDGDAMFAARASAYRLFRHDRDRAGAARMATWLACDQLDFHGAVTVAAGWLGRAHRLLGSLDTTPEHGWLAFLEGYVAHIGGDTPKAVELGRRAAELGEQLNVVDLEMLGLALEGGALVASGQVAEGMRRLDVATTISLEADATVPISSAWSCCFLVSACISVRDYDRAFEWCDRIAEFAERYGSRYMFAFCRAEYGSVHLWRGRWADAEAVLVASVEDFARSRPAMVAGPLVGLAELRRRQGRLEEAATLLDRAGPSSNAQLCSGRMALDRGDDARAVELGERCLRQVAAHLVLPRLPALDLLARARTARGELEEAGAALDGLREVARIVDTEPVRAGVDLATGRLAASGGAHEEARPLFEDAIDRFERSGAPFEAAQARIELARTLFALGRTADGQREATAALDRLDGLGAAVEADRARQLLRRRDSSAAPLPELTPREREVLALLADGLTNRLIAKRLVLSEHTVHRHVTNILRKLDRPSRTAAVAVAVRSGLLDHTVL
jgi:ATP/maltotriose-dependent transcriptional regulator MalT